jgi:DNA-binding winged helix-turn-helix (wHTH) protein/predicted ATPase
MPSQPSWTFGPFRLDLDAAILWRGSEAVPLRPKDFALLLSLVQQAGRVLPKEDLLEAVWPNTFVSDDVLKGAVARLRRALGDDPRSPQWIATVARHGYRFLGTPQAVSAAELPVPALAPEPPPPLLVGREAALTQLAWWQRALAGQRQVGFVTGPAGIGKTALVEAFLAQVTAQGLVVRGQCIEHYGPGEPYAPLLEVLDRLGRGPHRASLVDVLRQKAPMWLVQLPSLCPPEEAHVLQQRLVGTTAARMLRELAGALEAFTATAPLIIVLEHLHWSDTATLDTLAVLAQRREPARLLILGTYRPTDVRQAEQPLWALLPRLRQHGQDAELPLTVLSEDAVAAYMQVRWARADMPPALVQWLYERTEGHPLFLVTLVEYLEQHAVLAEDWNAAALEAQLPVLAQAVPDTLRQTVESHLLRLTPSEQQVLAAASVAGVTWSAAAVAAALDADVIEGETHCEGLVQHSPFLERITQAAWPDGTLATGYGFRHALYQQFLYERLPAAQRQQWHRRLGARLEAAYGAQVSEIAAELARHWHQGGDTAQAVRYRQQAAELALRRHAHREAISHLTSGLEMLTTLPDTPARAQQEIELQLALGPALTATKGLAAPEVERSYARARVLCQQVGEPPQLFSMLHGLWQFYVSRGAFPTARELGEQLLRLVPCEGASIHRLIAHAALGNTLFFLGEYTAAWAHCEKGGFLTEPTPQRVQALRYSVAPEVVCLTLAAYTLWCLGFPVQALQRSEEALALAQALGHPQTLAFAHHRAAYLHYRRREMAAVQAQADALLTLATAQEFPLWVGHGACWRGWVLAMQNQDEAGRAQLRQSMSVILATGQTLAQPFCLIQCAEAAGHVGQVVEGLRLLAEAVAALEASGRGDLLAEAYRLQGEFHLRQAIPDAAQAEACFQQALAIARRQQARAWELRAATSLSRLWQQQGKRAEAYELLAPVYDWFTEGFDTADLQEARALLDTLAHRPVKPLAQPS